MADPNLLAGKICQDMLGATPTFPGTFGILGSGWLSVSVIALLCSLLILTLIYMFAQAIRNQGLILWTKFELFQVFATAVVALFSIMMIVSGMCYFDMSFLGGNNPNQNRYLEQPSHAKKNMYKIVGDYFKELEETGKLLFLYMMYVVKQINFMSKVMWMSSPLGVGSSESPLESISQLNNLLFIMVSGFVVSFLLLGLQMRMMEYLAIAVLYFLFPFGIFFRSFEPTRTFGGTLIGLSIALFLFYPIIITFNDYIVFKSLSPVAPEIRSALNTAEGAGDPLTGEYVSGQVKDMADMYNNKPLQRAELELFSSGLSGSILFLLKPVMLYFIAAVVLPVINFIVLVEITRGVTAFFGEEIDITNLTRLI